MVSRIWGTWFREKEVHDFEGTGILGMGYIVSHHPVQGTVRYSLNHHFILVHNNQRWRGPYRMVVLTLSPFLSMVRNFHLTLFSSKDMSALLVSSEGSEGASAYSLVSRSTS